MDKLTEEHRGTQRQRRRLQRLATSLISSSGTETHGGEEEKRKKKKKKKKERRKKKREGSNGSRWLDQLKRTVAPLQLQNSKSEMEKRWKKLSIFCTESAKQPLKFQKIERGKAVQMGFGYCSFFSKTKLGFSEAVQIEPMFFIF